MCSSKDPAKNGEENNLQTVIERNKNKNYRLVFSEKEKSYIDAFKVLSNSRTLYFGYEETGSISKILYRKCENQTPLSNLEIDHGIDTGAYLPFN